MKKPVNALVTLITGRKPARIGQGAIVAPDRHDRLLPPPQQDADRLQRIAVVIENVVGELSRVEHLRMLLEALRDPISSEFDAQMKAIAQAAELNHRLSSTAARLAELEAEQKVLKEQFHENQTKLEQSASALDGQSTGRQAAEQELAELRAELSQARLQLEEFALRHAERESVSADLKIENKSLSTQLEKLITVSKELSSRAEQLQHDFVAATDQLNDARKRGETIQVRALRAERIVEDLQGMLSAERDRIADLESKIQATQASANRMIAAMQSKDDERLVEIAALRNRLGDVQTRCVSLEEAREKSVSELQTLNAERSDLNRDLAAREVELMQVRNRLESLETGLEEAKRRVGDVDTARVVAVQRADSLAKQLTSLEGRFVRSELAVEQKSSEIEALKAANDEFKLKLSTTSEDLRGVIVQQKSEIDMLRSALNAVQKTKQFIAATTS